jgi:hypothetical protein
MGSAATTNGYRKHGIVAVAMAVGLTVLFWNGLWQGGGLIGGDTYTYYYPQKTFFAERLHAGEFPLWNPLAGHGYPLVAESQTGALYPFNIVFYSLFDVIDAYNIVQIMHYVMAFLFTWMFARRVGISSSGALFAGLVFTYAWFPFRVSLEWAIITGAWFPAALWCAESFLQTRFWRYLIMLSAVLGLQLLAGHFNLAFITQLVLIAYIPGRLWFARRPLDAQAMKSRSLLLCALAVVTGFALAAAQLLPTWELKRDSQRAGVGKNHDPGQGYTPVSSWSQAVVPWIWYGIKRKPSDQIPKGSSRTNEIESHLYFGLIPLALLLYGLIRGGVLTSRENLLWIVLGAGSLIYTTGWLIPITKHLPGFSFFEGPGRYSLVTTFAVAMISAGVLGQLMDSLSPKERWAFFTLVFVGTSGDLLLVARQLEFSGVVISETPTLRYVEHSAVKEELLKEQQPVRLFSPGANLPALIGVSVTPPYLGIGPSAYYDPKTTLPQPLPFPKPPTSKQVKTPPTAVQIKWLREAGVTHVLAQYELDESHWPVTLIWSGFDEFFNRAWGHTTPLFLYRLKETQGRLYWGEGAESGTVQIGETGANFVRATVDSKQGGQLVLTELSYPGWEVFVDGELVPGEVVHGMYRGVHVPAGSHTVEWRFQSRSFFWGCVISILAMTFLATLAHLRFWHPQLFTKNS